MEDVQDKSVNCKKGTTALVYSPNSERLLRALKRLSRNCTRMVAFGQFENNSHLYRMAG